MSDKRQHERVESRIRCWCEGEDVTFYARVGNLSEGGLFLSTLTPLGRGVRTQLRFQRDEQDEVAAQATVVWARDDELHGPPGMGLAFDPLDSDTAERIKSLVDRERSRRSVTQETTPTPRSV